MSLGGSEKPHSSGDNAPEGEGTAAASKYTQPSYLAHLVEEMMYEMDVHDFDNRTSHLLVDLLQRETLKLLTSSVESSEARLKEEMKKLFENAQENIPEPRKKVTEQDAIMACQESMTKHVSQSSFLQDIKDMQKIANNVRLGVKNSPVMPPKVRSHPNSRFGDGGLGYFPCGPPPHLPESIALNTLLPNWDVKVPNTGPTSKNGT